MKYLLILLALTACTPTAESNLIYDDYGNIIEGTLKQYSKTGKLLREAPYHEGKLHGIVKTFYESGKVKTEISYLNGVKEGIALRYYEEGVKYQEYLYKKDTFDGIQKKYFRNGNLMSELRMVGGKPTKDLKEYYTSGKLRELPVIEFDTEERLAVNGYFALKLRMSDNSKSVKFYFGKLDENGCIPENADPIPVINGEGIVDFYLDRGQFIMREIFVIAHNVTRARNPQLTESMYRLSVENRTKY